MAVHSLLRLVLLSLAGLSVLLSLAPMPSSGSSSKTSGEARASGLIQDIRTFGRVPQAVRGNDPEQVAEPIIVVLTLLESYIDTRVESVAFLYAPNCRSGFRRGRQVCGVRRPILTVEILRGEREGPLVNRPSRC